MPIRFRCAYCNQLLGISRRKAGTVVRCPTCAGQVVVPDVDVEGGEKNAGEAEPLIFERSDFDELLNPTEAGGTPLPKKKGVLSSSEGPVVLPATAAPPEGAWGTHAEPAYDVKRINTTTPAGGVRHATALPEGIFLTRRNAILLAVAAVVALGIAFGMGLVVGKSLNSAPEATREG